MSELEARLDVDAAKREKAMLDECESRPWITVCMLICELSRSVFEGAEQTSNSDGERADREQLSKWRLVGQGTSTAVSRSSENQLQSIGTHQSMPNLAAHRNARCGSGSRSREKPQLVATRRNLNQANLHA